MVAVIRAWPRVVTTAGEACDSSVTFRQHRRVEAGERLHAASEGGVEEVEREIVLDAPDVSNSGSQAAGLPRNTSGTSHRSAKLECAARRKFPYPTTLGADDSPSNICWRRGAMTGLSDAPGSRVGTATVEYSAGTSGSKTCAEPSSGRMAFTRARR